MWRGAASATGNLGHFLTSLIYQTLYRGLARAGAKYFKSFKILLEKVQTEGPEGLRSAEVAELKESLCRAVACYRAALAGARDPGNLFRSKEERSAGVDKTTGRVTARALVVCGSYLAPRVWPSARISVYAGAAEALAAALELGGEDVAWVEGGEGRRGVGEVFREMVEELRVDLPGLVEGVREMSRAGEKVSLVCWYFFICSYRRLQASLIGGVRYPRSVAVWDC